MPRGTSTAPTPLPARGVTSCRDRSHAVPSSSSMRPGNPDNMHTLDELGDVVQKRIVRHRGEAKEGRDLLGRWRRSA